MSETRRCLKIGLLLGLALTSLPVVPAAATQNTLAASDSRITALDGKPFARSGILGRSVEGRPLRFVLLTSPDTSDVRTDDRIRVLILAGQHGDEPMAVRSMLDLASELSATKRPIHRMIMSKLVVAMVPEVNPDGLAARRRTNSHGADLNRDWVNPGQPETMAIASFVRDYRPQVIIDEHEWTDSLGCHANIIEAPGWGDGAPHRLARLLASVAVRSTSGSGCPVDIVRYRRQSDQRLAHRAFTERKACALLIETSPRWSPAMRRRAYRDLTISILTNLALPPNASAAHDLRNVVDSLGQASPRIAAMYPVPRVEQSPVASRTGYWFALFAIAAYVIGWQIAGRKSNEHDEAIPARAKRGRMAFTDVVRLDAPPRAKLSVIKEYRPRPSDRQHVRRQTALY